MNEFVNLATEFINGVGFPIAACCFMGYRSVKEEKTRQEAFDKQREDFKSMLAEVENSHKVSIDSVVQALNQNTQVLSELTQILKKGE